MLKAAVMSPPVRTAKDQGNPWAAPAAAKVTQGQTLVKIRPRRRRRCRQRDVAGTRIIVHVAGAVASPGIVRLAAGARVFEAIEAAGGARKEAQLEALNLAAPLTDGQQVYVPTPDEAGPPPVPGTGSASGPGAVAAAEPERAAAPQTVPPARSTSTRPLPRNSRNRHVWDRCWPGGSSSSASSTAPTGNRLTWTRCRASGRSCLRRWWSW